TLLPRYWSPSFQAATGEWRYGLLTGSSDPLGRHAYALEVLRGSATGRLDAAAVYQYDRFWPTLTVAAQDTTAPEAGGTLLLRNREVNVSVGLPLTRSFRMAQSVSVGWRLRKESLENAPGFAPLNLGGLELAWYLSSAKLYPYSISPTDGWQVQLAYLKEDPFFGGDVSLGKMTFDGRGYLRLGTEKTVLAVRLGGGATFGSPRFVQSFAVGGFPEGSLSDVIDTNFTVLRGYPDDAFFGRSFVHGNLEYRFPLLFPEHGFRSLPFFLRHLHGAVFADAASVWVGPFKASDVRTAVGAAVGFDMSLSQAFPLTATFGVARGLQTLGETRVYARLGLSF
ncbi:MAG TPA: BamA/TamA family outer membrane protein, partial [Vicinamibacteria bacterium]|nr:BamA/TamA family outer membrane protein [Vicinamibacteria bacterium]